jgi:hypothetical protein
MLLPLLLLHHQICCLVVVSHHPPYTFPVPHLSHMEPPPGPSKQNKPPKKHEPQLRFHCLAIHTNPCINPSIFDIQNVKPFRLQIPTFTELAVVSAMGAVCSMTYSTIAWVMSVINGQVANVQYTLKGQTVANSVFGAMSALSGIAFACVLLARPLTGLLLLAPFLYDSRLPIVPELCLVLLAYCLHPACTLSTRLAPTPLLTVCMHVHTCTTLFPPAGPLQGGAHDGSHACILVGLGCT